MPESAKGPAIEPGKGYRIQKLGEGLFMITDNGYQSMFMVYEAGVVVVDAPPFYAQYIPKCTGSRPERLSVDMVLCDQNGQHSTGLSRRAAEFIELGSLNLIMTVAISRFSNNDCSPHKGW